MRTLKPVLEKTKIGAQGSFIKRQILPQVVPIKSWFLWDGSESGHISFFLLHILFSRWRNSTKLVRNVRWTDILPFTHENWSKNIFFAHFYAKPNLVCADVPFNGLASHKKHVTKITLLINWDSCQDQSNRILGATRTLKLYILLSFSS